MANLKNEYREHLECFFEEYGYPDEAAKSLLTAYDKLTENGEAREAFFRLVNEYNESYLIDYSAQLDKMGEISGTAGIHEYEGKFLLYLCYAKKLPDYYAEAGYDVEICKTSLYDLKYKVIECKLVKGIWGSFVCPWFNGFFDLTRFAFGKLQFEIMSFGEAFTSRGVTLVPESRVINVHIPRTGERLDEGARRSSYALAADFFKRVYSLENVVFACYSWLLFPKNREFLKQGSNLLAFIEDYELYKWGEYDTPCDIWRLFDMDYTPDHSKLPADTSLRRAYIKLLDSGEKTGYGKGVFVYEN